MSSKSSVVPGDVRESLVAVESWLLNGMLSMFAFLLLASPAYAQTMAANTRLKPDALQNLSMDFWNWRARYQPFSADDIPRIEHPDGHRTWSRAASRCPMW